MVSRARQRIRGFTAGGGAVVIPPAATTLYPGAAWNGTAGSGYAGSPPTRTGTAVNARSDLGWMHGTVAPAAQFVWPLPVDEMFTEDADVIVSAWAASASGNVVGGIASVTFFCEGRAVIKTAPTTKLISCRTDSGGTELRPAEVWSATLDYALFSGNGAVDIYATIQPTLAGVAVRTIGPVRAFRKPAVDRTIDITPSLGATAGVRYPTVQAALAYLNAAGVDGEHARLRWTETGFIDPSLVAFTDCRTNTNARSGQVIVDANGFDVLSRRSTGSFTTFEPRFNGLVFKGVRFDVANYSVMTTENGVTNTGFRATLMEDCEVYSTAGVSESVNGTGTSRAVGIFNSQYFVRRTWLHDFDPGSMPVFGFIGCGFNTISNDILRVNGDSGGSTTFQSPLFFMNSANNLREGINKTPTPAFSISYSAGGTPTYSITGSFSTTARTLNLFVNAGLVQSVVASVTVGSGIYTITEAVAAINAQTGTTGFSATFIQGNRRFANISGIGYSASSTVPATTVAGATNIGTAVDTHVDLLQYSPTANHENVIAYGLRSINQEGQTFLLTMNTGQSAYNCAFIGNGVATSSNVSQASQMDTAHFHCLIAHNSLIGQNLVLRRDDAAFSMDSFSRICSNVFRSLSRVGTLGVLDATAKGNILTETPGFSVTGTYVTEAPVITDLPTDNFPEMYATSTYASLQPINTGYIALNPVARQTVFDVAGTARGGTSLAGTYATARSAFDFTLSSATITTTWGTQTVGTLIPSGAPAGAYFALVEDINPSSDYAGLAVVNG